MPRRRSAAVESPAARKSPRAAAQVQAKAVESPASTRGSRSRSTSSKPEKTSPVSSSRGSRSRSRPSKAEQNVEANEEVVEESTPRGRSSRRGAATKEETATPSPRGKGRLTRGGLQEEKKAATSSAKSKKSGRGRSRGRGKKQEEEEAEEEQEEAEEEEEEEEEPAAEEEAEEDPVEEAPAKASSRGGRGRSRGRGKKQEDEEEEEQAEEEAVEEEKASPAEESPVKVTPRGGRAGRNRGKQAKEPVAEAEEEQNVEEAPSGRGRRSRGGRVLEKPTPPKASPRSRRGKAEAVAEDVKEAEPEPAEEEAKDEPSPRRRSRGGKKEPAAKTVTPPRTGSRRSRSKEDVKEENVDVQAEAENKEEVEAVPVEQPEKEEPDIAGAEEPENKEEPEAVTAEKSESPEEPGAAKPEEARPEEQVEADIADAGETEEAEQVPSGIETPPEEAAAQPVSEEVPAEEPMEVEDDHAGAAEPIAAETAGIPSKVDEEKEPEVAAAPLSAENVSQLSPPAEDIAEPPAEEIADAPVNTSSVPLPSQTVPEAVEPEAAEPDAPINSTEASEHTAPKTTTADATESPTVGATIPEGTSEESGEDDIMLISLEKTEAVAPSTEAVETVSISPPPEEVPLPNSEKDADEHAPSESSNNSLVTDSVPPPASAPSEQVVNQQDETVVPGRKRSYDEVEDEEEDDDDLTAKKAKVVSQPQEEEAFEVLETSATLANGSEEPPEKPDQVEPNIVEVQPMEVQDKDASAASGEGDFNVNMSVEPAAPTIAQETTDTTGSTSTDDVLKEYVVIEMSDVPGANSGAVQEASPSPQQLAKTSDALTETSVSQSTESANNHLSQDSQTLPPSQKDPLFSRLYVANPNIQSDSLVPARQFSVVSYNILADCWMNRYAECYTFASPKAKDTSSRQSRLMEEIRYLDADIVCLQEVEASYYESTLFPAMTSLGYGGDFKSRAAVEGNREGEATFYRNSRFTLVQSEGHLLRELAEKEIESSALADDVRESARKYMNLPDVVIVTNLQCKQTGNTISVANIHVNFGRFKIPNAQCIQISCAIKELVLKANNGTSPHIICGDFNSPPNSPGYQLARDGYLSDEMIQKLQSSEDMDMPDGSKSALVNHLWKGFQHTSSTLKSSYNTVQGAEPDCTSAVKSLIHHCLDYIFYSSGTLDAVGILKVVPEDVIAADVGLPSEIFPSDHLSLKTVLTFK